MAIDKPYPNIYRHGPSGVIRAYEDLRKEWSGQNYINSYFLLKDDLKRIFEYIEPREENCNIYSHRIYEILVRACTEVESLCKIVFERNRVKLGKEANIIRYSDLENPMKLSEYEIRLHRYNYPAIRPFQGFKKNNREERGPSWYSDYNKVKHNRLDNFRLASLANAIQAVGGVFVLLEAEFGYGFDSWLQFKYSGGTLIVPSIFSVTNRPDWTQEESYNFNWDQIKNDTNPWGFHPIPVIKSR